MGNNKIRNGFIWKTMERFSVMGVQFLLQLMLAQILSPEDFGIVAILTIFVAFTNVIAQSGLTTALVQKKEISEIEISSVFNFSIAVGIIAYIIIFISAPYIGAFFNMPHLVLPLRIIMLSIFPFLYNSVQISLLRRELKFKILFLCTIVATVLSGGSAIYMALRGYGIWALIVQQLLYSSIICILITFIQKWRPKPVLKLKIIKPLINYGSKVLGTSLVNELFVELRTIVIGGMYSASSLAFFNRGRSFPDLLMKSIIASMQAVLLPVLSQRQSNINIDTLRSATRKSIMLSSYITWPLLTMLAICAPAFISLVLTDKWLPCVKFIYIFCIYFSVWPIETINLQLYYAVGRSGLVLKIETLRKFFDLVALLATMYFGVIWIAVGAAIVSVLCIPLYMMSCRTVINYSIMEQIRDVTPNMITTLLSGVLAYMISYIEIGNLSLMVLQVITFVLIYYALSNTFRLRAMEYLKEYVRTR